MFVSGLYEIGCQFTPPCGPGAIATNLSRPGGVYISFAATTGAFSMPFGRSFSMRATSFAGTGSCGMNSPLRGIGCVADVFWVASWSTGFSSMPYRSMSIDISATTSSGDRQRNFLVKMSWQ